MGDVFYIIYSFLGFLCSIIPSFWHWKYRNVAPLCLIFWVSITNLICFLNAIIWFNGSKTKYSGYIYCDIAIKFTLVSVTGQLGAITAISHYLSKIMKPKHSSIQTKTIRRRQAIEDLLLSFTLPIIMMSLHYIVQPRRYIIDGINGCISWLDRSWPTIIIILIWSPILGVIAAYFSTEVIILYFKKRKEFQNILKDSKSSMTFSRFVRLIGISFLMIAIYLPLNIYILYFNIIKITEKDIKYSWSAIHKWDNNIIVYSNNNIIFSYWLSSSNGIAIFIFFGMGSDALAMYKEIAKKLGIVQCFHFIQKKIFKKKTEDTKNEENFYNSYEFEKSLNRCPPLFYSQTKDIKIIESDSLNNYPSNHSLTDYNKVRNYTDDSF